MSAVKAFSFTPSCVVFSLPRDTASDFPPHNLDRACGVAERGVGAFIAPGPYVLL